VNCITEYIIIYLKHVNEQTKAARPSDNTTGTQEISYVYEVNGAAIDASA
jgi:hypothetical protein